MFGSHAGTSQLSRERKRSAHRLRAGGIRRKLVIVVVLLIAGIGVLPTIIVKTHLRNALVAMALPNDAIRITIGSASVSWFSNPSISNVEVKNAAGDTLLVAESIHIDRTPLKLALNTHDLGNIQIVHPTIHVQVRPDGNSISDVLLKLQGNPSAAEASPNVPVQPQSHASARQPTFTIELVGATVIADDIATSRQWRLQ